MTSFSAIKRPDRTRGNRMKKSRTIALLAMPGVQLLGVSGPLDVFAAANVEAGAEAYRLRVIGTRPGPIRSSSGARLLPDFVIGDRMTEKLDTLWVAGCPNAAEVSPDARSMDWLRKTVPSVRRYGSVCSGAFVLAAGGLLGGRRGAAHSGRARQL